MASVKAIYKNGKIILKKKINTKEPIEVTVTFPSRIRKNKRQKGQLDLEAFAFKKSQKLLRNLKSSLSEEIIKERRIAL